MSKMLKAYTLGQLSAAIAA